MLVDFAKKFAKDNGCSRIELNVWAFNKEAYDFWANQGMKEQRHTMEYIVINTLTYAFSHNRQSARQVSKRPHLLVFLGFLIS